jgi:hypothetical protein
VIFVIPLALNHSEADWHVVPSLPALHQFICAHLNRRCRKGYIYTTFTTQRKADQIVGAVNILIYQWRDVYTDRLTGKFREGKETARY